MKEGDRPMDAGQENIDGNAVEARRVQGATHDLQTNSTNALMDTFAQMMTAMTQLIQNSQTGAGGSGGATVDKHLKLFQDMGPPLFSGAGGPIEAENWLLRVEKIIDSLFCPADRRVTLATFVFEGDAERWWQGQVQEKFGGRPNSMIRWEDFVRVFRYWFVPLSTRRQLDDKFIRLVQGDRSVMQYETEFSTLTRYDGNAAEVRRVQGATHDPQTSGKIAPMDTFAQMMIAVTQLIQNPQLEAGGSGGATIDKHLKLFQYMRPPLFSGAGGPIEAENWLLRVEKIIDGLFCPADKRVALATFTFEGEAERWWQEQVQEKFGGIPNSMIKWEDFVRIFRDWFVPLSARRQMQDKFIRLMQGDRSIMQYEVEFTTLSRYAPHLIPNAEEKCYRFLSGLKDVIRQPLIPLGIDDYSMLVERARRIEIDLQATQKCRDFQKRKFIEGSRGIQTSQSGSSSWKRSKSSNNGSNTNTSKCEKCGRTHKGECLSSNNTCFRCYQPGHIVKNCPIYGHMSSAEVRTNVAPPQRSLARQRMTQSTASAPSQPQARQNM